MASEWNLRVHLECIGVVSEGCCKEVYNYIDFLIIIYYLSLLHLYYFSSFFAAASLLLSSLFF